MRVLMHATPDYAAAVGDTTTFWYAFGPVLYRGRPGWQRPRHVHRVRSRSR